MRVLCPVVVFLVCSSIVRVGSFHLPASKLLPTSRRRTRWAPSLLLSTPSGGPTSSNNRRPTTIPKRALGSFAYALTSPFPGLRDVLQSGSRSRRKETDNNDASSTSTVTVFPIRYAILGVAAYFAVGVLAYHYCFEKWTISDALYFTIVCFSTVGYGDLTPITVGGKLFTCIFGFSGIALLGSVIASLGTKLVALEVEAAQRAQRQGRRRLLSIYDKTLPKLLHRKKAGTNTDDLVDLPAAPKPLFAGSASWKVVKWIGKSLLVMLTGGLAIGRLEGWSPVDSIYFAMMTGTTIGLGDFSPQKRWSRIIAIVMIPTLVAAAGEVLAGIGLSVVERRQKLVYEKQLKAGLSFEHIKAMDSDGDGKVSREEYIFYMLQEMGAITQREVQELSSQFSRLDMSRTGFIETQDVLLLQELRKDAMNETTLL